MPRLDLSGINLAGALRSNSQTRIKRELHIQPSITVQTEPVRIFPVKSISICCCLMLACVLFLSSTFTREKTVHMNFQKGGQLRRMIRMKCQTRHRITYCSTSQSSRGDYVVSVGNCKDVYEFNNIPFTDIFKDEFGNYRVPSSIDSTLQIKEACDNIAATVDTVKKSHDVYSTSQSNSDGPIEKLVWITSNCYKDFTVKINGQIIYEATPVTMITKKTLHEKSAYIYVPDVDYLRGSISIQGTGCDSPIIIYTTRS